MPVQIQTPSITQSLARTFGFKGSYNPVLDEVVVPVHVLPDPSPARPRKLAIAYAEFAAAGVNTPQIQLRNPIDSGVILNVTRMAGTIIHAAGGAKVAQIRLNTAEPDSGVPSQKTWRDGRLARGVASGSKPVGTLYRGGVPAVPGAPLAVMWFPDLQIGTQGVWQHPETPLWVLQRGGDLTFTASDGIGGLLSTGDIMSIGLFWEEVPLKESVGQSAGTP